MTEHEIDKLFDKLDRIEKRLDKLERAPDRELKIGSSRPRPAMYTGAIGLFHD